MKPKIMIIRIFFLLLIIVTTISSMSNHEVYLDIDTDSITEDKLYVKIQESDILFPDVVFAQAIIESGYFSSEVFKCNSNLFGMKHPKLRTTLSMGKSDSGYAWYLNWKLSVYDYKLWQNFTLRNKNITSQQDYLNLIGRIYAEDGRYVKKLEQIIQKNKKIKQNNILKL